jgi:hypothetical protein
MSDQDGRGNFFQFPLCLLAQNLPFAELLDLSIRFGIGHYLDKTNSNWRATQRSREAGMASARSVVSFTNGSSSAIISGHAEVARLESEWRAAGRKTSWVRLRSNFFFDMRNECSFSERDWRVLCGLYSAIGDQPMVKIGWEGIQRRAAGWLTRPPPGGKPCGPMYPRGQVEGSLAKLVKRTLVFVATYKRGERFWSHRLNQDEIWTKIGERKSRTAHKVHERTALDALRSAELQQKLSQLTHGAPPVSTPSGLPVPLTPHTGANGAAHHLGNHQASPTPQKVAGSIPDGNRPANRTDVDTFFQALGVAPAHGEDFFDYYEARGWVAGRSFVFPSWQNMARTWVSYIGDYSHSR